MTAEAEKFRSVYGRGFYDGKRKVLEQMNNARYASIERGLTGVARKVFEVIPYGTPWSTQQIASELARLGSHVDFKVVSGCLNSLHEQGMVREQGNGIWLRTAAPQMPQLVKPEKKEEPMVAKVAEVATVAAPADPMDKLARIAAEARTLAAAATSIANLIEEVAIETESRIEKVQADTSKLRQLQELLKSLG